MRRIARSIVFFINVVNITLLLLSVLGAYISPVHSSFLSFLSFGFPLFFVLNIFFGLLWIFRLRKRVIFSIFAIIIAWGQWGNVFQMKSNTVKHLSSLHKPLSIMSYNVRMFDRYNWTGDKGTPDKVYQFFKDQNPDILCIQEFYVNNKVPRYSESKILSKFNQYKYRHIDYNITTKSGRKFGLATFSKYPIVWKKPLYFKNTSNFSIQSDINVKGMRIRVINNHLESIRLKIKNYHFIDSITYLNEKRRREGFKDIFGKMNNAFASRSFQAESIGRHIQNSPFPTIVCGDFNDVPTSYVYRTVRGDLKDAFVESGYGFGGTYYGNLPSFRIDYIFYNKLFKSYNYKHEKVFYSDHYPIKTLLDLAPK